MHSVICLRVHHRVVQLHRSRKLLKLTMTVLCATQSISDVNPIFLRLSNSEVRRVHLSISTNETSNYKYDKENCWEANNVASPLVDVDCRTTSIRVASWNSCIMLLLFTTLCNGLADGPEGKRLSIRNPRLRSFG